MCDIADRLLNNNLACGAWPRVAFYTYLIFFSTSKNDDSGHNMKELLAPAASRMWGAAMGSFLLMIGTENGHDVKQRSEQRQGPSFQVLQFPHVRSNE